MTGREVAATHAVPGRGLPRTRVGLLPLVDLDIEARRRAQAQPCHRALAAEPPPHWER